MIPAEVQGRFYMEKTFDCVKFQREQRIKLAKQTAKMSNEELIKHYNSFLPKVKMKKKVLEKVS